MKQQFGRSFVLIPIGLFLISGTLIALKTLHVSDPLLGTVMGIGIGLCTLPFVARKVKPQ